MPEFSNKSEKQNIGESLLSDGLTSTEPCFDQLAESFRASAAKPLQVRQHTQVRSSGESLHRSWKGKYLASKSGRQTLWHAVTFVSIGTLHPIAAIDDVRSLLLITCPSDSKCCGCWSVYHYRSPRAEKHQLVRLDQDAQETRPGHSTTS